MSLQTHAFLESSGSQKVPLDVRDVVRLRVVVVEARQATRASGAGAVAEGEFFAGRR